ncbi:MAG: ABC transporter substrate-binding protein, partial [Dehalococcoidia bacterium]
MSDKSMKMVAALAAMVVVLALLVASCGPTPAPEVVEKIVKETVVVEKEIEVIKEVEKEVEVIKEVEKEVEVIKEVEKEVVVTATPEPMEEGPVSGGHLFLGFETTLEDTGDLHQAGSSHSAALAGNVLDTLIRQDPADGTYHPGLAESWEVADDNLSITLYLRQDVKFHDGTPFNAEAVKYNLDRILTVPGAQGQSAYTWLGVGEYFDKVEVIDEYTVKLSYKKVYALMIWCLSTGPVGGMHSPTAIEEYGDGYGTEIAVTTGPFEWVAWTGPTGILTTKRNEEYNWASPIYKHQGPAYLDGFTTQGILETSTRAAAVEAGSLHEAPVADKDMGRFNDMPGFKTIPVPKRMNTNALWFNLND